MCDVGQGGGEHGQVSRVTQNLHRTCNEVGTYIEAYGTKSKFLPKMLTFFPVFFFDPVDIGNCDPAEVMGRLVFIIFYYSI